MKRAAALVLLAGCQATVPEVHARAVAQHLEGLSTEAGRVARESTRHARCWDGQDPVAHRARSLDARLAEMAATAVRHEGGDWPSQKAFHETLGEAQTAQAELAMLRAEYDACRAHSATPTDIDGIRLAPGVRRVALLPLQDPQAVLPIETRRRLDTYLQAKLSTMFALVPRAAMAEAEAEHVTQEGCSPACALAVARDVGAHKTLVVTVRQQQERCAVFLALLDLATGVTERARTVRNDCALESVVSGFEDALAPLE